MATRTLDELIQWHSRELGPTPEDCGHEGCGSECYLWLHFQQQEPIRVATLGLLEELQRRRNEPVDRIVLLDDPPASRVPEAEWRALREERLRTGNWEHPDE